MHGVLWKCKPCLLHNLLEDSENGSEDGIVTCLAGLPGRLADELRCYHFVERPENTPVCRYPTMPGLLVGLMSNSLGMFWNLRRRQTLDDPDELTLQAAESRILMTGSEYEVPACPGYGNKFTASPGVAAAPKLQQQDIMSLLNMIYKCTQPSARVRTTRNHIEKETMLLQ